MVYGVLRFINFAHGDVLHARRVRRLLSRAHVVRNRFPPVSIVSAASLIVVLSLALYLRGHRHAHRVSRLSSAAQPPRAHRAHHRHRRVACSSNTPASTRPSSARRTKAFPELAPGRQPGISADSRVSTTQVIVLVLPCCCWPRSRFIVQTHPHRHGDARRVLQRAGRRADGREHQLASSPSPSASARRWRRGRHSLRDDLHRASSR